MFVRPQSLCSSADFIKVLSIVSMDSRQSSQKGSASGHSPRSLGSLLLGASPFATMPVPAIIEELAGKNVSMCESRAGLGQTLQRQKSTFGPPQLLSTGGMGSMQLQGFSDGALALAPPLCRISATIECCLKVGAAVADVDPI